MFITTDEQHKHLIHFNASDMEEVITAGENVRITLSADKAKELEDRLERALKG